LLSGYEILKTDLILYKAFDRHARDVLTAASSAIMSPSPITTLLDP
jgi:hypothetical protein